MSPWPVKRTCLCLRYQLPHLDKAFAPLYFSLPTLSSLSAMMLSSTLRTSTRRALSAVATIKRPAAQVAQSSRSFVQPTHIDRATVIDAPHISEEHFAPTPGEAPHHTYCHQHSGLTQRLFYLRSQMPSASAWRRSNKTSAQFTSICRLAGTSNVQLVLSQTAETWLLISGYDSDGPPSFGCHVTVHDGAVWEPS